MDKKTIDAYDQRATEYDEETSSFWDEMFPTNFMDRFVETVKSEGVTTLDVGSGPGRDGLILQNKGLDITCLDASKEMIKLCQKRGLKAVLGDFNELPFADGSFDAVWAYTSLLHVPKKQISKPLEEIRRILKSGGILGLGLIEGDFEGYRESSGLDLPRWFTYYKKDEVEALLGASSFEIVHFEQFKPRSKNYLNYICVKE
jgi:ubiquinone/menaquinone biosynthesis C-methylase UbiE